MEELINKSDGQFKDILDDLVDHRKHASKKDPLIKELSRPKIIKPAASLNSSTYSSAASSTSSSSSTASDSSSTSSASSTSSSPSQSSQVALSASLNSNNKDDQLEMAKLEDLGKTAKILEHTLALNSDPSILSAATVAVAAVSTSPTVSTNLSGASVSANLAQKYTSLNDITSNNNVSSFSAGSWKTKVAKRDKRKQKEIMIKAGAMPGNMGEKSVEELENFIKSGTNNTSNNSNNKNSGKNKPQNSNSSNTLNNSNRHNISLKANNSSNSSGSNNSTNTNANKKNDSHLVNNNNNTKSNQSSKMNSTSQSRNPPQISQPSQLIAPAAIVTKAVSSSQNSQSVPKQQTSVEANRGDNHQQQTQKNHNKQITRCQTDGPLDSQQQSMKPSVTIVMNKSQSQPQRKVQQQQQQTSPSQPQNQPKQQSQQQETLRKVNGEAVVTFAQHINVRDEDADQYTFGFFEEQPKPTQHTKLNNKSQNQDDTSRNQASQCQLPTQNNEIKQSKQKHLKASPISEETTFRSNDNIDANSFNYDQILKFISNAWINTQAKVATPNNH